MKRRRPLALLLLVAAVGGWLLWTRTAGGQAPPFAVPSVRVDGGPELPTSCVPYEYFVLDDPGNEANCFCTELNTWTCGGAGSGGPARSSAAMVYFSPSRSMRAEPIKPLAPVSSTISSRCCG